MESGGRRDERSLARERSGPSMNQREHRSVCGTLDAILRMGRSGAPPGVPDGEPQVGHLGQKDRTRP